MAQGYCIHMVHIFYIHTSIKDLEMIHSIQYNAEAHDPVIIYSWCVFMCLVIIITTYIHTWWPSASNNVRMIEK
jgi:hypothetical protein